MHAFTLLSFPFAFLGLVAWLWQPETKRQTYRMAFRGALLAIPALLIWMIFSFAYRPAWGSVALALSFLARFWILPFGLLAAAWALARGYRGLGRGADYRELFGFSFGFLSVFNIAHGSVLWGESYFAWTLVLPLLLLSSAPFFTAMLDETARDGMPDGIKWIAATLGAFAFAALSLALLFLRLEWLGALLAAGYAAGTGWLGWKRLEKRH